MLGQHRGKAPAQALRGAGDQRDVAGQVEQVAHRVLLKEDRRLPGLRKKDRALITKIRAAVDRQDHAVGVARGVARQIAHGVDHLGHAGEPAQRIGAREVLALALAQLIGHRALDHRGCDRVAVDAVPGAFERVALGQRVHARLGGAVGGMERGAADLAGQRADVDDPPAAASAHHLERRGAAVEGAGEVDLDDPLPVGRIGFEHLDHAQDSCGVDPKLQGARLGRGALGQGEHSGAIGHVQMHRHQPRARLDRNDVAAIDPIAFGEERFGERLTEVAGGADDLPGGHPAISAARRRNACFCSLPLALRGSGSVPRSRIPAPCSRRGASGRRRGPALRSVGCRGR